MKKQRKKRHYSSRLERIERKCDRLLSEIIIIRQILRQKPAGVDDVIERMHVTARRLKEQCERECEVVRSRFFPFAPER